MGFKPLNLVGVPDLPQWRMGRSLCTARSPWVCRPWNFANGPEPPPSSHGCGRTASDEELVQPDWVTQTANSRATRSGFRQKGDHRTVSLEALLETLLEIRRSRTSIAAAATGAGVDLEGFAIQEHRMFEMTKKAKHKSKKSKEERERDKDDRMTPRDDDRDRTLPEDQKHEE